MSAMFPMTLAICVLEDVSKHRDILTLEFLAILEIPTILPRFQRILRLLLVRRNLVVLL